MPNTIVARLEKIDELKRDIVAMAKRPQQYGVKPHDYNLVEAALLWTLQKSFGDDWNDEVKAAWVIVMLFQLV